MAEMVGVFFLIYLCLITLTIREKLQLYIVEDKISHAMKT